MPDVNIPAVASGAFLGFLALLGIVACVPPVTRFLGDLFCCPWRMPFTKKKRRNGDEEMEQTDFPYLSGKHGSEQHFDTPGHYRESNRMSAAYMSVSNIFQSRDHPRQEGCFCQTFSCFYKFANSTHRPSALSIPSTPKRNGREAQNIVAAESTAWEPHPITNLIRLATTTVAR